LRGGREFADRKTNHSVPGLPRTSKRLSACRETDGVELLKVEAMKAGAVEFLTKSFQRRVAFDRDTECH
jgi:hypothetical protein